MPPIDYFAILGVPQSCELDRAVLDDQYRKLQAKWHPDHFVNDTEAARKLALQQASLVNDAYQVLKQPLKRAEHLLGLCDEEPTQHGALKLPAEFLLQQLESRELLEQLSAKRDDAVFARMQSETHSALQSQWSTFVADMTQQDWCSARLSLQKLQFLQRLQEELNHLEDRWLDN